MSADAFSAAFDAMPYARTLGVAPLAGDDRTARLSFSNLLIGNPLLPALHGGAVAAFMEMTAIAALAAQAGRDRPPRPVDVTIAYLRSARPQDVLARADVRKVGRRIAYVHVLAWQDDEAAAVAEMSAHFLIPRE